MNERSKLWIKATKNALVNNDKILNILLKHCPLKSRHKLWIKIRTEKENRGLTKEERDQSRIIGYSTEPKMSRKRKKMIRLAKKLGMKLTMPNMKRKNFINKNS